MSGSGLRFSYGNTCDRNGFSSGGLEPRRRLRVLSRKNRTVAIPAALFAGGGGRIVSGRSKEFTPTNDNFSNDFFLIFA